MLKDLIIYTPMYITLFWCINLLYNGGYQNNKANKAKLSLGVFMGGAFLLYLSHAIFFHHDAASYIIFDPIYTFATLSVYPLYYIYIRSLTIDEQFDHKQLMVFLPAILLSIATAILYYLMSPDERASYIKTFLFQGHIPEVKPPLITLQIATYVMARVSFIALIAYVFIKGRKLILNYNARIAEYYSNVDNKSIKWVNKLLYLFLLASILGIIFNILGRSVFFDSIWALLIPSLLFSSLLFAIGYQGNLQDYYIQNFTEELKLTPPKENLASASDSLQKDLIELFEKEKVFKKPELKITDLARQLNSNRTYVSRMINQEFSCSFNEFVNRYRVIEAKRIMDNKKNKDIDLNDLGMVVGFGSMSTFERTFKKEIGHSPKNYIRSGT